jgi:hypothetical protein
MGQLNLISHHALAILSGMLLCGSGNAQASFGNSSTPTFTFAFPSGYTSASFNASAQPTASIPQTDFSDRALGALWQQIGPVATGPVTTTVEPTPEPTSYGKPGAIHPLVASHDPNLAGLKLPKGFKWGVAASSYQIEGAANAEGKGPSIWDLLSHRVTNHVSDNSTGDVVASHYWLYKQDFARLKTLGIPGEMTMCELLD